MGDFIANQPVPTVKGPRNYVQLSDGSTDLMFNSNLYLTSNGLVGGHIGGSGQAPQMAYFTAPETIASTSAATVGLGGGGGPPNDQILLGDGSVAAPALGFQNSATTGIYRPAANRVGITVNGTLEADVSTTHLSLLAATAATPSMNFGLSATDTNTGIFSPAADQVGISVGGVETANVSSTGLTVGKPGAFVSTLGLRRVSTNYANSWEDGHMGNSEELVFTLSDFMIANPTMGTRPPAGVALTTAFVNAVGAGSGWDQPTGARFGDIVLGTATSDDALVATKLIPKGFQIKDSDTCTILGKANTPGCQLSVFARQVKNLVGIGNTPGNVQENNAYTINSAETLTNLTMESGDTPVVGNGNYYIGIYFSPGAQLTSQNGIVGAKITMSRV